MEFSKNGEVLTTRWNLMITFMVKGNSLLDHLKEDPHPVMVSGDYASLQREKV